jgi:hypothetical protein
VNLDGFAATNGFANVRLEDMNDLVGHSSTSVTETIYRHEIRPSSRPLPQTRRSPTRETSGSQVGSH